MTNRKATQAQPEGNSPAMGPQMESQIEQLTLGMNIDATTIKDALGGDLAERLQNHCKAQHHEPAAAVAAAVQCYLDLAEDVPATQRKPRGAVSRAPSIGKVFTPALHGLSRCEWTLHDLGKLIACYLNSAAEFFADCILAGPAARARIARDAWAEVRHGEWAEMLKLCEYIEDPANQEWECRSMAERGLCIWLSQNAEDVLSALGLSFGPHAPEIGELAMDHLSIGEALDLIEALIVLEQIAHEWHHVATDFDKEGPTRLQLMAARLRQQFYLSTPLAA